MLDHDEFPQFARKSQAVEIDGVGDSGTSSAASGSQILQFVAANGGRSPAPSPPPAESAMRVHIQASVEQSLGQMLEFERFGHNRLLPKAVDLDELKSRLRAMKWRPLQRWQRDVLHLLEAPALAFIDKFKLYSKGRGLPGANLDLINFKLRLLQEGLDENSADYELFRQANLLAEHIGATLDLFPSLMFYANAPSWQGLVQKTRGRLFDEVLPVPAERPPINRPFTQQFNQIVNSALWEERIKREVRGGEVRSKANKLLTGVRLRGNFADEVRGESGGGTELADYIHDVCQVLPGVLEAIKRTSKVLLPSHVDPAPLADSAQGFFARAADRESDLNKKLDAPADIIPKGLKPQMSGLTLATTAESAFLSIKNTLAKLGSKTVKTAYRGLQLAYVANPASNQAVLAAGLILLDSLQQTMRDVGRTRNAVQPLRDAVALQRELRREAAQPLTPALGERLQSDADGWQLKAQAAEKTLLEELERLTPLAVDSGWQALLSDIRDQLKQAPSAARNTIDRFDEVIKEQVRNLAAIHSEVREQTLRLARLGMAGRADFDLYLRYWTQQLQASKNQLKSDLVKATGHSAANFSRHGMLSRGWAEAAEADKQRYLQQLPEADRAEAGVLYQRLLLEALEDHLPLFAKETDPNGKRLLHRLRTELGHAERGTTVYPATMAEILAGVKSTSQEISLWSRKRLATGLLLGIAMGTFSLASLGWKVTARVVLTGHKLVSAARTASQGVRVGQGKASDELREYAKHSVKTAAVKLVVSMTPGLSSALGVATVVWDAYEGGLEGAVDKILLDIAEGLPMMPVHEARGFVTDTASDWAIRLKDHLQQMLHEAPREEAASTDAAVDEPAVAAKLSTSLSTHDELSRIAQSDDPARSALARRLQAQLGDAEVPMSRSNQGGTSLYSPTHHQIELAADADDWVMLHEIAHSLTANKLRFGLRNPDSELGKTAASIEALRQTALAAYQGTDTDTRHYLSTAEEFVAGLYSGKADFIEHLKSIDTGSDSVLSLLVDAICWLLGIPEQKTALTEAMGLSEELMGLQGGTIEGADELETAEPNLYSTAAEALPGWKNIGQFNSAGRPVPLGQHVQLTFGYKDGGTWNVVIEIPQSQRDWPAWKEYVARYLNTETVLLKWPWLRPVRVGEVKAGDFQAASPGSPHEVFVPSASPAQWMIVGFADKPTAANGTPFIHAPDEGTEVIDSVEPPSPVSGFRPIGAIDRSSMSFAADKQLHLHFVHRSGERISVAIEVPENQRANGQWQRYAVDYINNNLKTVQLGGLHAEVATVDGVSLAKVYTGNSDIVRVSWSFDARTQVPGTDLEFPHRDRYRQEGARIIALLADQKNLEAQRSEAQARWPGASTPALDRQLEDIAAQISNARLVTRDLYEAAQAENDLVLALMAARQVVAPTDNPSADSLANTKADNLRLSGQLSAIQTYRARLEWNSAWHSGEEHGARQGKLDLLEAEIKAQIELNARIIQDLQQVVATQEENVRIRARNLLRAGSARRNYAAALDLQTQLNRVTEELTNAWRYARHQKVLDKDLANMPAALTAADIPDTDASGELLARRDRILSEIATLNATIKQAEDTPEEKELSVGGASESPQIAAEPSVPAEPEVSKAEFDGLKANARHKVDSWIVESAKRRGLDITLADLDKPVTVRHSFGGQTRMGVATDGARNKIYSLRQLLLGEADRYVSIDLGAATGVSIIDTSRRGLLEETTDPVIIFLRSGFGTLPSKPNRLGVASDVMASVEAAIDEHVQRPQVQAGFRVGARGRIATTLLDNPQQIDGAGTVYQQIAKGFLAGRIEATPVYVKGVVVPGVAAIGQGDHRIIVSLDERKFVMFNALAANKSLAQLLKDHMPELDKNKISEADVRAETTFVPRQGFTTRASSTITFGDAKEDVYSTLLQASAAKLKSNLGGVIYTREEADDDLNRDMKKALVASLGVWLTIFSGGASAALQFHLGVAAAMASVATDVYIDDQNAINSDRLSDKLKSERDVRVGKMLGAISLVLPFISKVKMSDSMRDVVDIASEITGFFVVAGVTPTTQHVSKGPGLSQQDAPAPVQEASDSHALAPKPPHSPT